MLKLFRKWHNWLGVAISLPTLIVGITAIFITFQDSYKDKPNEPQINVAWLPGYSPALMKKELLKKSNEVRASLFLSDDIHLIGTGYGLLAVYTDSVHVFNELYGYEVHCLQKTDSLLWIGSKKGLYSMQLPFGALTHRYEKDVHHIEIVDNKTILVADNKGLYKTSDGGLSWEKEPIKAFKLSEQLLASLEPPKTLELHKFIMDLHTGKAFFGKTFEWIWIFFVGLSVTVLTFTGVYMWYRKQKQKNRKRRTGKEEQEKKIKVAQAAQA